MKEHYSQQGFTLIEVVIALGVLGFGIISILAMQVHGIRGNAVASTITTEANYASQRVEEIVEADYDQLEVRCRPTALNDISTGPGKITTIGNYSIFCNVVDYMSPDPSGGDAYVKAVRVFVQRNGVANPNVVELNYYKQKVF